MKLTSIAITLAFICGTVTYTCAQNAIHFDGTNDVVQTTFDGVLGSNNRTFEAWVKVDVGAPSSNLCIMDYGLNAIGSRNTLSVGSTRGLVFISGGTNANISSTTNVITEGQWTHIAFVLNNGTGYLYVNGAQVGTGSLTTVNTPSNGQDLRIGERVSGGTIPFKGAIDEVRIWNVARTATEIANNRNAEFCTVPSNLVAYYNFNQGTAGGTNTGLTSLHNAILNENGTLSNFSMSGATSNWVSGVTITHGLTVSKNTESTCDSMVSPSGNYSWTSTGVYYDTVTNANNCDSIMRFNLTVNNSIYEVINDTSCVPYTAPSGTLTFINSGTYFDTTITPQGCNHIYELNLEIDIIDTTVSLSGSEMTSNEPGASYTWLDCNNNFTPVPGSTSQTFTPLANGNYAAQIEKNGCVDTSECVEITWLGNNLISRIDQLNIFPNPSIGDLYIDLGNLTDVEITVYALDQRVVYYLAGISGGGLHQFTLDAPSGIYMVEIQSAGQVGYVKLVME